MKIGQNTFLSVLCLLINCISMPSRIVVIEETFTYIPKKSNVFVSPSTVAHESYQEERQPIVVQYNFSQSSNIENTIENIQKNRNEAPLPAPEPAKQPSLKDIIRDQVIDYATNPFVLGAAACFGYLFYCASSKFNLYSLGKACIEKAAWSLWKHKATGDNLDDLDTDTALLIQILNTYNADNYTAAVAHFLQDVEAESAALTAYIRQAKNIQEGTLRFIFNDLSEQIKQAEERLESLQRIKNVVMGWLNRKKKDEFEPSLTLKTSVAW